MVRKLVLRGVLTGAIAGVLAFVFARITVEPVIGKAIDYEEGRDSAQAMLDRAAGRAPSPPDPDIFSRTIQANVGVGVGIVLFGVAMGALFAVAYAVCLGRVGSIRPRTLALLVAAGGFLAIYLVPFVKYPANPPAIGNPDTIGTRGGLYLLMVLCSVVLLGCAVWLGRRLAARLGTYSAALLAGAAFVVVIGVVMALLPTPGHLSTNVAEFGLRATETPRPLKNPQGTIVYPGFPADVLFTFRFYSVAAQLILWAVLGLTFAPLAERLLGPRPTGETLTIEHEPVGM